MSEMDRKRNRARIESVLYLLNAAFVETDGSEKNLEAAVFCLSKNKILHRSSKHNAILSLFHCVSALT